MSKRTPGDRRQFRFLRRELRLSLEACAELVGVTSRTIRYRLLRLLNGSALPGPDWEGFRVVGDTLYTPEGHGFSVFDFQWWSLTCRRAEAFAAVYRQLENLRREHARRHGEGLVAVDRAANANRWGDGVLEARTRPDRGSNGDRQTDPSFSPVALSAAPERSTLPRRVPLEPGRGPFLGASVRPSGCVAPDPEPSAGPAGR